MTEETNRLILSIKEKTSLIIKEVERLKAENSNLAQQLESTIVELDNSREKQKELESRYKTLKIAKTLSNSEDSDAVKKRINAMVREIDTCIGLIEQ